MIALATALAPGFGAVGRLLTARPLLTAALVLLLGIGTVTLLWRHAAHRAEEARAQATEAVRSAEALTAARDADEQAHVSLEIARAETRAETDQLRKDLTDVLGEAGGDLVDDSTAVFYDSLRRQRAGGGH